MTNSKIINKALKFYTGDRGRNYHQTVNCVDKHSFHQVALARKKKLQPFISNNDTILEFGSGTGWNISELNCKRKIAFDVSDQFKQDFEKIGIEFVSDVSLVPDNSIDKVICHHVLEHLPSPAQALEEIRRILSPDGYLLLFVPVEEGLRFSFYNRNDQNHHLYSWNCQSLGNLISLCGFRLIECKKMKFGFQKISATINSFFQGNQKFFNLINRLFHIIRQDQEIFVLAKTDQISSK
jgi:SAM-dependent methyltransferase